MTATVEAFAYRGFCLHGHIAYACAPTQVRVSLWDRTKVCELMSDKKFVAVAKLEDLPPGGKKVVDVEGTEIILCNTKDRIFAVRNLCSHAHETLECGRIRNGWISCPVHGARFDLETGNPMNPPASLPIDTFEVRIEGDTIEVAV